MTKTIPTTILLASNNAKKLAELKNLILGTTFNILTADDLKISELPDIEEDGNSYEENAIKKACGFSHYTNLPCIADDSGLEVDALNGEPGIYSGRWSGVNGAGSTEANNAKLLDMLQHTPYEERTAKFVCVIVLAYKDQVIFSVRGECEGRIVEKPVGEKGFGYDPLFEVPAYNKTFAQLNSVKNKISHRAKALEAFKEKLTALKTL